MKSRNNLKPGSVIILAIVLIAIYLCQFWRSNHVVARML